MFIQAALSSPLSLPLQPLPGAFRRALEIANYIHSISGLRRLIDLLEREHRTGEQGWQRTRRRRREALLQKAELVVRALVAARLQSFRAARMKSAHPCPIHVFVWKGSGTLPSKDGSSNHLMVQPYGRLSVATENP